MMLGCCIWAVEVTVANPKDPRVSWGINGSDIWAVLRSLVERMSRMQGDQSLGQHYSLASLEVKLSPNIIALTMKLVIMQQSAFRLHVFLWHLRMVMMGCLGTATRASAFFSPCPQYSPILLHNHISTVSSLQHITTHWKHSFTYRIMSHHYDYTNQ